MQLCVCMGRWLSYHNSYYNHVDVDDNGTATADRIEFCRRAIETRQTDFHRVGRVQLTTDNKAESTRLGLQASRCR